jgi:hypothetical protein
MKEDLRYPIGPFVSPVEMTAELRARLVDELANAPVLLRKAVGELSADQIDTPYREGGWTVRQVVHHVADSHLNGYVRMKLALTEDLPIIKPYDQEDWAAITDRRAPIEASLRLLEGLHELWTRMLRALSEEQWRRGFIHPSLVVQATKEQHADEAWKRGFVADERGVLTAYRHRPFTWPPKPTQT